MKLLILGAGGFIGSHLTEHLAQRGEHEVTAADVTSEKLSSVDRSKFQFIDTDVRDIPESMYEQCDVVVDLVAYANPSIYVESPLEVFDLNFNRNLEVVQLCVKHGKRLIQYSTSEVYGKAQPGQQLYHEDSSDLVMGPVTKQRWIYASAKQLLERVIHAQGLRGDLDYTILRPFNFVGPRFDYLVPAGTIGGPRVFAHFMSALLENGPMRLVDGGAVHRTFLAISEANEAFQTLLDSPGAHNQVFNVGNPANNISIRDLALLMQDLYRETTGREPACELTEISGEEFYGVGYEDMDRVPPSIAKLEALGWSPTRDLRSTFSEAMNYYVEHEAPV
jgi:UDP-apiose/xylose synthase